MKVLASFAAFTVAILTSSVLVVAAGPGIGLADVMLYEAHQSGLLVQLPFGALHGAGGSTPLYPVCETAILFSLDLDQIEPGNQQTVFVLEGDTITVTGEFQMWSRPGELDQLFFIYSWTPSWPIPYPSSYWHGLYHGGPGDYPGTGIQSFSFELTVPDEGGVYFLYLGTEAHYSYEDALARFKYPIFIPYAVIIVGSIPY